MPARSGADAPTPKATGRSRSTRRESRDTQQDSVGGALHDSTETSTGADLSGANGLIGDSGKTRKTMPPVKRATEASSKTEKRQRRLSPIASDIDIRSFQFDEQQLEPIVSPIRSECGRLFQKHRAKNNASVDKLVDESKRLQAVRPSDRSDRNHSPSVLPVYRARDIAIRGSSEVLDDSALPEASEIDEFYIPDDPLGSGISVQCVEVDGVRNLRRTAITRRLSPRRPRTAEKKPAQTLPCAYPLGSPQRDEQAAQARKRGRFVDESPTFVPAVIHEAMLSGVRPLKSVPKGSPEATSTGVDAPTTAVIVSPAAAKKAEDSSLRLVEQAQTEARVLARVNELRKEGLWSAKKLPKIALPDRVKNNWDFLLEEAEWIQKDFVDERSKRRRVCRKIARAVDRYHAEQRQAAARRDADQQRQLRRVANDVAKCVMSHWKEMQKVWEKKQQSGVEAEQSRLMAAQMNAVLQKSAHYSQSLAKRFSGPVPLAAAPLSPAGARPAETSGMSAVSAPSEGSAARELLGDDAESESESAGGKSDDYTPLEDRDDEATIDEDEQQGADDEKEERDGLAQDAEMNIGQLLEGLPPGYSLPAGCLGALGAKASQSSAMPPSTSEKGGSRSRRMARSSASSPSTAAASDTLDDDNLIPIDTEAARLCEEAKRLQPSHAASATTDEEAIEAPPLLRGELREYQMIGLKWLAELHRHGLNALLADEMGLGKTIQTIALFAYLASAFNDWGPHLIIVPTSVVLNWELECKKWLPGFAVLSYYGAARERRLKRVGWSKPHAFNVCVTSYQIALQDFNIFRRKRWRYLVLDEAQAIKNWKSQRWQRISQINSAHRLLLTGTPLQNRLEELWSLMNFLQPNMFESLPTFLRSFSDPLMGMIEGSRAYDSRAINRLYKVIRPFMLRRLKADVEKQLPGKVEDVIYCQLSKRQRQLYEDFMARSKTKETLAAGNYLSVINILMQLRKVCNHPNLFEPRPVLSPFVVRYNDVPKVIAPRCTLNIAKSTEERLSMWRYADTGAERALRIRAAELTASGSELSEPTPLRFPSLAVRRAVTKGFRVPPFPRAVAVLRQLTHATATPSNVSSLRSSSLKAALESNEAGIGSSASPPKLGHVDSLMESVRNRRQLDDQQRTESLGLRNWERANAAATLLPCFADTMYAVSQLGDVHQRAIRIAENQLTLVGSLCWHDCDWQTKNLVLYHPHAICETATNLTAVSTRRFDSAGFPVTPFVTGLEALAMGDDGYEQYREHVARLTRPNRRADGTLNEILPGDCRLKMAESSRIDSAAGIDEARHRARIAMLLGFPENRLIEYDCGKLRELQLLMKRIIAGGHRALIFTQMTKMLDVLEAFLSYHGYKYLRLDGATRVEDRQNLMDRFNADCRITCFILSTRAGGLGVNLTGADTVIFYDSDWNPAMDAQAQDRCHRIGQTRNVYIHRLILRSTVEESILRKAYDKRRLNEIAIDSGGFQPSYFQKADLQDIFGIPRDCLPDAPTDSTGEPRPTMSAPVSDDVYLQDAYAAAEDEEDRQAAVKLQSEQEQYLHEDDLPADDAALGEGDAVGGGDETFDFQQEAMENVEELERRLGHLRGVDQYILRRFSDLADNKYALEIERTKEELECLRQEWVQSNSPGVAAADVPSPSGVATVHRGCRMLIEEMDDDDDTDDHKAELDDDNDDDDDAVRSDGDDRSPLAIESTMTTRARRAATTTVLGPDGRPRSPITTAIGDTVRRMQRRNGRGGGGGDGESPLRAELCGQSVLKVGERSLRSIAAAPISLSSAGPGERPSESSELRDVDALAADDGESRILRTRRGQPRSSAAPRARANYRHGRRRGARTAATSRTLAVGESDSDETDATTVASRGDSVSGRRRGRGRGGRGAARRSRSAPRATRSSR